MESNADVQMSSEGLPSLPVELLEDIIDRLSLSKRTDTKPALHQCMLVSKAFYQRSRIHIFSDVCIRVQHSMAVSLCHFATFLEILQYRNRYWDIPSVAKSIQSFTVDFGGIDKEDCLRIIASEEFVTIFKLLRMEGRESLRSLTITKQDHVYLPWDRLPQIFLQSLYILCLSPSIERVSIHRVADIPSLFFNTSTIKHLCLIKCGVRRYTKEELSRQNLPPFGSTVVISPGLETLDISLATLNDLHLLLLGSQDQILVSPISTLTKLTVRFALSAARISEENQTSLQSILVQAPLLTSLEIENFHKLRERLDLSDLSYLRHIRYAIKHNASNDGFQFSTTLLPALELKHNSFELFIPFSSLSKRSTTLFQSQPVFSMWTNLLAYFTARLFESQVMAVLHVDIVNDEECLGDIEEIESRARDFLLHTFYPLIVSRTGRFRCVVTRTPFYNDKQVSLTPQRLTTCRSTSSLSDISDTSSS